MDNNPLGLNINRNPHFNPAQGNQASAQNPDRDGKAAHTVVQIDAVDTEIKKLLQEPANMATTSVARFVSVVKNPKATIEGRFKILQNIAHVPLKNQCLAYLALDSTVSQANRIKAAQAIEDDALKNNILASIPTEDKPNSADRIEALLSTQDIARRDLELLSIIKDSKTPIASKKQALTQIQTKERIDEALSTLAQSEELEANQRLFYINKISNTQLKDQALYAMVQDKSLHEFDRSVAANKILEENLKHKASEVMSLDSSLSLNTRLQKLGCIKNPGIVNRVLEALSKDITIAASEELYEAFINYNRTDLVLAAMNQSLEDLDEGTKEAVCKQKIAAAQVLYNANLENKAINTIMPLIAQDIQVSVGDRLTALRLMDRDKISFKDEIYAAIAKDNNISPQQRVYAASLIHHVIKKDEAYSVIAKASILPEEQRLKASQRIKDVNQQQAVCSYMAQDTTISEEERLKLAECITDSDCRDDIYYKFVEETNLTIANRLEAIDAIENSDKKDCACLVMAQDHSVTGHALNALLRKISTTSIKIRDQIYIAFIKNQKADPRQRLERLRQITEQTLFEDLMKALIQDSSISANSNLYMLLIERNQLDVVLEIMNTSLEGLDEAGQERVRLKKVAAAEAVIEVDNENIAAIYIIATMTNPDANSPYTLYQTVINKSKEAIDLGAILEKKKAQLASQLEDCTVYFNKNVFLLPSVMDAQWEEGFEEIDFAFFNENIKAIFQGCRDGLESNMAQLEDIGDIEAIKTEIKENEDLEKSYLEYFGGEGRSTLQNALNTKNKQSVHGNKMKQIAKAIQECIAEDMFNDGLGILADLKVNMETCEGGDQQAIEMSYMNRMLSRGQEAQKEKSLNQAEVSVRIGTEKVLNILYRMRSNWVLENHTTVRNGKDCLAYSPEKEGESFVEHILKAFPETKDFLKGNSFSDTHNGLAIMGFAGKELGLRSKESNPAFDPNCACVQLFIQSPLITKANILEAFTNAFTFENMWGILSKELFKSLSTASELGYKLFKDEVCTKEVDLSVGQDPLAYGATAFLKNIGFEMDVINKSFETVQCYYKDTLYEEIYPANIIVGFSKQGLAEILLKLGLLSQL